MGRSYGPTWYIEEEGRAGNGDRRADPETKKKQQIEKSRHGRAWFQQFVLPAHEHHEFNASLGDLW